MLNRKFGGTDIVYNIRDIKVGIFAIASLSNSMEGVGGSGAGRKDL